MGLTTYVKRDMLGGEKAAEKIVPCRIRVIGLPSNTFEVYSHIKLGIQRGKDEVLGPAKLDHHEAVFSFEVRVKPGSRSRSINFLGPYIQGPSHDRFVYLSWSGVTAGKRKMFRRIKVSLNSITGVQVQRAVDGGFRLEVRISGIGRDGGPACASVPLLGRGWRVAP